MKFIICIDIYPSILYAYLANVATPPRTISRGVDCYDRDYHNVCVDVLYSINYSI